MSKSILGLDIGTSAIKVVQAEVEDGKAVIVKAASRAITPGLVVRGQVQAERVEELGAEIRSLLDDSEITETETIIGINNTDTFSTSAVIPFMEPDDLKESIITQVQGGGLISGVSPDESELDYIVLNDTGPATGSDRKLTIFLVMPKSDHIENAALAAQAAGLEVVGADVNALASLRASRVTQFDTGSFVDIIIDMGAVLTSVVIHQYGVPRYIYTDDKIGGEIVTKSIQKEADFRSFEEAEQAKLRGGTEADVVGMTIYKSCKHIATKIKQIIDSYLLHVDDVNSLRSITLIGGGSLLQGLKDTIASKINVPVELGYFDEDYTSESGSIIAAYLEDGSSTIVASGLTTGIEV